MIRWCLSQRYKQNSVWLPWFSRFRRRLYEPGGSDSKASACNVGDQGSVSRSGRSPEEGNGYPLNILAWRIPWPEGPGGLQTMGLQRIRHNWLTNTHILGASGGWKLTFFFFSIQTRTNGLRRGSENHHNMLFPEIQKHIVHFIFFTSLLGFNYVLSGLPW